MAFDPDVDGRRLTFEVVYVYNGSFAIQDRQTASVWSPLLGQAIRGRLKGTKLRMLPLVQCEWQGWTDRHPSTQVLAGHLGTRGGHGGDQSIGSPGMPAGFRMSIASWDDRLAHNTLVLGVVLGNEQRAYTLAGLRRLGGVVNDDLDEVPIVAFAGLENGSHAALAFRRVVDGQSLTFATGANGPTDRETGTIWSIEGGAVSGPLAGARLSFVSSHVAEWYIWAAYYPGMEIGVDGQPG
jgi:hypothetical protein